MISRAEIYTDTIHGFCLDLLTSEVPEYSEYEALAKVHVGEGATMGLGGVWVTAAA